MAYIKEDDYQKLANAAAIDLIDNHIPLNDSVAKLASQFELNQDQLYRLCEATNNTAFNQIFKKKAASSDADNLVDFEVADAKKILGDQIKEAAAPFSVTDANADLRELRELPNLMDYVRHPDTTHISVKTAEASSDAVRIRVVGKGGDLQIFSVNQGFWQMPTGVAQEKENRKDAALRILLSKTGLRAQPAQLNYAGLQSFRGKMYHTFEVDAEKLTRANYPMDEKGNKPRIEYRKEAGFELRPENKPRLDADIRTLEKTAEYIKQEKIAAEQQYNDLLKDISAEFKLLYQNVAFEDFEKQAVSSFGKTAAAPLNNIRNALKKPQVNYNIEKIAKTAGYIDDLNENKPLQLFTQLIKTAEQITQYSLGLTRLDTAIKTAYNDLRLHQ